MVTAWKEQDVKTIDAGVLAVSYLEDGPPDGWPIMDPFVKTLGRGNLRWRHLLSPADWQGCVHR